MVLETTENLAVWAVEKKAERIVGSERAPAFGERARVPGPTAATIVESAVAVCRKHNLTLAGACEFTLALALGTVAWQWRGLMRDLDALAKEMRSSAPPGSPPAVTPAATVAQTADEAARFAADRAAADALGK